MDSNLVKAATARILKARTELILTRTFYGVLVGQVAPIASSQFPTMATDGKHHYYNPVFIDTLTQAELLGVQAHESEHDARRHHTRRGFRDAEEWNICTDYAINIDLVDQGFALPKGALIDAKYRGMSAEDIYRTREIDRAEAERKRQQEQAAADQAGDDDEAGAEPEQGDDDGDDSQEQDGGQDDESDAAGGEDAEQAADGDDSQDDGQGTDGQGEGAGEAKGEADGDGADEGSAGDGGEAQGDASGGTGQGDGKTDAEGHGTDPRSSGDPGGCGEVLDAAPDVAGKVDEDAKWERVLRQAARLAAKRGDAPGHVAREIERADHPPQDWRETLRAYFDGGAATNETWNRPNRRFIGAGLYLPGRVRDGVNKVVFMIDTSGSVTYYPGALEAIQVETQAALDEGFIDEAAVIYGDVQVTRVDHYRNGDEIEFDPRGGGGTVMRPLFDHVAEEVDDASLIVAFTDLEIEPEDQLGPEPRCPVLWAVVGYPESVKHYMANTPWNAPAIEVRPDV